MTDKQKIEINKIYEAYKQNMSEYGSYNPTDYCLLETYRNEVNPEDKNIVVEWVRISGLNDSLLPFTQYKQILVEPEGFANEMKALTDVFYNQSEINKYIRKLTKFNWDAK
jgi:hypothetical protein